MKKLQIVSFILLVAAMVGWLLWLFMLPLPDWFMRADGLIMIAAIFFTVFSTVRIAIATK